MPALGTPWRQGTGDSFPIPVDADGRRDGPALSLRSVAHLPFWATNVDTNTDRVTTFLAAHPGTFFCNACLRIEVPVPKPIKVNQLIRALHGVTPYRSGRVVCFSCGEVRECIAYGSSVQVTGRSPSSRHLSAKYCASISQ